MYALSIPQRLQLGLVTTSGPLNVQSPWPSSIQVTEFPSCRLLLSKYSTCGMGLLRVSFCITWKP